ncbi:hypothetical protein GCM10022247_34000 [Allokutzneria multivorans]|uniref:OmpR/PhoB-type domain-containing protein n=1 Tax=Allokutzneria multivorans TaxID=1142134 RepID=A0ABP7SAP2_9PSEU
MDFRVLGPVLVRELVLGAGKHRAVLAVLLLEANRAVRIERLIDLLWADQPPERARNLVSGYVSKVRKALDGRAGVRVETWRGGYRLVVHPDSVDLYRFRGLVREAREATGDDAVVAALAEALALWSGPALADVDLPGLAPSVTEALEQERVAAFEDLVDARLRIGADIDLIGQIGEAVDAHPFRERLVGQLMTALAQRGRPAEALATFRRCADALRDELGVPPGAALRELERAIRADSLTPAPASRLRPAQLPADLADFLGRDAELAALSTGEGPLLITGMPGVGKTALAVHWAHRERERFPDGQLHVDLRGEVTPRQALLRLLDGLGVRPEQGDERALAARFRSTVDGKKLLVLLDGATSSAQVLPLLPGSPTCQVVITSARRLDALVLHSGAKSVHLNGFRASESVALINSVLGDRALRDPVTVRRLATLCCGLPVAVRSAAVLLAAHPAWPVSHLASRLADEKRWADSLALSEDGFRMVSALRDLPEGARELLGYFGLLPREDLGTEALTLLTKRPRWWVEEGLSTLHDAHFLAETVPGVYYLPTVVRLCAKSFLPEHEEADAALERWRYPGVVRLFAVGSA